MKRLLLWEEKPSEESNNTYLKFSTKRKNEMTNKTQSSRNPQDPIDEQIKQIIKDEINPYLAMHSGSCDFISYEEGIVTISLKGGCSGCPSSQITLFNGITPILKEHFPEITDVMLDQTTPSL